MEKLWFLWFFVVVGQHKIDFSLFHFSLFSLSLLVCFLPGKFNQAAEYYNISLIKKSFQKIGQPVLAYKRKAMLAHQLNEMHLFRKLKHMFRFWHWWSNRANALQLHFSTRHKHSIFIKWRAMWSEAKFLKDGEELAEMHHANFQLRKAFVVWEDVYVRNKLDLQLLNGALAWGRRKLVERTWRAWVDASKGLFDGVDGAVGGECA